VSVLLVSGHSESRDFIAKGLGELGITVDAAADATDGFFLASTKLYDGIVIGRVLNDICGLSLIGFMRSNGVETPVIVICDRYDLDDTLAAFEYGADDVMCRPVQVAELHARLRVAQRRGGPAREERILSVGDLTMNRLTRQVRRGDVEILLQPRCYSLLEILMVNAGSVVTRTTLLERVWEYHFDPQTSVIETHISRLRDKVDKPFDTQLIRTVRGGGYMICEPAMMSGAA